MHKDIDSLLKLTLSIPMISQETVRDEMILWK